MSEVAEQTQASEPVSIESRISSYVASEDHPPEEQGYSTEAQPEDAQQNSEENGSESQEATGSEETQVAEEPPQDEFEELTWNG